LVYSALKALSNQATPGHRLGKNPSYRPQRSKTCRKFTAYFKFKSLSEVIVILKPVSTPANEPTKEIEETALVIAETFPVSPLIRLTLLSLYIVLTTPLPFLAQATAGPSLTPALWLGIVVGGGVLYATLTEQVIVDQSGIRVAYPRWVPPFFRPGWQLAWSDVKALKARTTGQGGLVYYFVSHTQQAYLLPMRVAGFARLVRRVQAETGIDTTDVKPLSQPWMYLILLSFTGLLGLVDGWTIWAAMTLNT
jgi:hypothetical protein